MTACTNDRLERVLVIGATGSIGRLVVERLQEVGLTPRALSRDIDRARRTLGANVDVVQGDLAHNDTLTKTIADVDAVVMTHGASYGSGNYRAIDYGAVPDVLTALAGREVRVALMSSIGVTGDVGSSRELLNWKRRGERLLRASGLPYTIVRPGWFDAGSDTEQHIDLRQGDRTEYGPVRRVDVAAILAEAIRTSSAMLRYAAMQPRKMGADLGIKALGILTAVLVYPAAVTISMLVAMLLFVVPERRAESQPPLIKATN